MYQLYRDGVRLPPEDIKAGGVVGWLTLGTRGPLSSRERFARLWPVEVAQCPGGRELITGLARPGIDLIKGGGLLLSGAEDRLYWEPRACQKWWVVPMPVPPSAAAGGAGGK